MREEWINAIYDAPETFRQDTLSICLAGDLMMHTRQIETADRGASGFDFSSYFELIEDKIQDADIAIANMEFTLAGEPYTGYPCFSAPDEYAEYAADCGFDVFLAANNHIFDRGSEGAARTLSIYRELEKERGIKTAGLAENEEARNDNYPLIIRRKGISIALINITYGTNSGATGHWPKTNYIGKQSELSNALAKAEEADFTLVLPHWGPEYETTHSESQEILAEWLIDKGADAIIGTHPHVVQDTAYIKNVPVAYSLGNAVSNMSAANTQLEILATLKIVRHGNGDLEMLPLELTWLWCSRPGGFRNDYTVIPVEEYIDRKEEWMGGWDYEKMITTYNRIRKNF